jgi:hypothetical protein
MSELLGTMGCCCSRRKSRNCCLIWAAVFMGRERRDWLKREAKLAEARER